MHDDVDAVGDCWHHEFGVDVAPGEQGQRAELRQGIPSAVGVNRTHAWEATIEGNQQIERFGLTHLADDQPVGSHPQSLFDEAPEPDLARALEARLATLHRDRVSRR